MYHSMRAWELPLRMIITPLCATDENATSSPEHRHFRAISLHSSCVRVDLFHYLRMHVRTTGTSWVIFETYEAKLLMKRRDPGVTKCAATV